MKDCNHIWLELKKFNGLHETGYSWCKRCGCIKIKEFAYGNNTYCHPSISKKGRKRNILLLEYLIK